MTHVTPQMVLTHWQLDANTVGLHVGVLACAGTYLLAASRRSPRGNRWPTARTAWCLAGLALFAFVYGSGMQTYEDDPTVHVVGHLLVMMAVPPLLVFGAPITLLLRTLPVGARRAIVRELKDPAFKPLSGRWAPWFLAADYYLTLFIYQLTPLHSLTEQHPVAHFAMHQYMLVCGLLFWLPIAGVDPVRFRPSQRTKHLMLAAGMPLFALLGTIELAKGDGATGWAYIAGGAILTSAGSMIVQARTGGVSRLAHRAAVALSTTAVPGQ
jgi:putative copper resistance protein D